jgi:MscS family membrane protein
MSHRLSIAPITCSGYLFLIFAGLGPLVLRASAQPAQTGQPTPSPGPAAKEKPKEVPLIERLRSPYEADRPVAEKLRSPRETLKTLYFAVILYDLFPEMIADAVACLDLDALQPRPASEDAAMLALDLENILDGLALPLSGVSDQAAGDSVVLHDAAGIKLALRRGTDGGWRFDTGTLERLPAMRRAECERRQQRPATPASLREGFTDPRATMRQFISDVANGDFYAAARALDLSSLGTEQRRQQGPALAQQLAFVLQRQGFVFRQEVPDRPDGPPYSWHADSHGRIALDRVRQSDGKDAWLFTRLTVRNIPAMYAAVQDADPNHRYLRLGMIVPGWQASNAPEAKKRPEDVPAHRGSPRALLQGFFRTMDAAEADDARLADALEYLDLDSVPLADRGSLGTKLAAKLETVLRKIPMDLSAIPDDWNAPPQVLGEAQGCRVDILRQRDGCWCFSAATVARIPEMFDKLAGKTSSEQGRGSNLDSARDLVMTFQDAAGHRDFPQAAHCLDLSEINVSARAVLGPVLAFKLKYVLDRLGRIYVQEIPDNPDGPRYVLYRGDLGRIVLDRKVHDPGKGVWQFTPETVQLIEPMFRAVFGKPLDESQQDGVGVLAAPCFWETPGIWLRLKLPHWLQVRLEPLDLYQWLGFALAALASWLGTRITLAGVSRLVAWLLHRSGLALSVRFVTAAFKPLMWLAAAWIFFFLLAGLDLPVAVAGYWFATEKFLLAALFGWLGLRLIDLSMGIYTNTESLRPHRNLSDMIVPVSMRLGKATVLLFVATYVIYQVGQIELLIRFLTGLGFAGLAASLAAQDAMKSFFGTLLLIGERAFKIGDRILVGGTEGVVEQVGFRSTRLRTAEDSLITIPNAIIAAAPIDNMGARSHHRFSSTIVISPETPFERLQEFRGRLRAWLDQHPLVVRNKVDVHIHQISYQGVELSLNLFLATNAPAEEIHFREAVNCEILHQAAELGVDLAPRHLGLLREKSSARAAADSAERQPRAA